MNKAKKILEATLKKYRNNAKIGFGGLVKAHWNKMADELEEAIKELESPLENSKAVQKIDRLKKVLISYEDIEAEFKAEFPKLFKNQPDMIKGYLNRFDYDKVMINRAFAKKIEKIINEPA